MDIMSFLDEMLTHLSQPVPPQGAPEWEVETTLWPMDSETATDGPDTTSSIPLDDYATNETGLNTTTETAGKTNQKF